MAAVTPVYALPYQTLGDQPNGATLGQNLALAVETELVRIDAAQVAATAALAAAVATLNATITAGAVRMVRLSSDQPLTASSVVYQNVTALVLSVTANTSYMGVLALAAQNASSTAEDCKFTFAFPALSAMDHLGTRLVAAATAVSGDLDVQARLNITSAAGGQGFATISANPTGAVEVFTLRTGANAGSLQVMAAQLIAGVPITSVKAGSFMVLWKS